MSPNFPRKIRGIPRKRHLKMYISNIKMSSEKFLCDKCNKTFYSLGNLNIHIKTVCSDSIVHISCQYCNQKFKTKSSLIRHTSSCKIKLEQDSIREHTNKSELTLLKEKYEKETLEHKTETLVLNAELKNTKQQILYLESEIKRLSDLLSTLTEKMPVVDQSTTNTVNINVNLFDHLNPITEETFFQYGQELTQSVFLQGMESVLNLGMKHFKDKIVCTDRSRNTLNYKINDQLVKDKGGIRLAEQLIEQSIEPKIKLYDKSLIDTYTRKSKDPTVLKEEQSRLDSMIELRNAIITNDDELKSKIGSKLSKRAMTNHALLADMNGATTQNMWEYFTSVDKSKERVLFNSVEYFLVRDANKNVIRALLVDDDGIPITDAEIDFSEQVQKLLPPPMRKTDSTLQDISKKKTRGRPKKVKAPDIFNI
jgi:hypothetical protein